MSTSLVKTAMMKGSAHAWDLLADFISQLTEERSHWFLINSPGVNDFDLMRLLGMTTNEYDAFLLSAGLTKRDKRSDKLAVDKDQWHLFLSTHFPCSESVEFSTFKVKVETTDPINRKTYSAIRIGDKSKVDFGNKQNTFGVQLKKTDLRPPRPPALRALQRQLLRGSCEGIIATIIREKDLYEAAMNALDEIKNKKTAVAAGTTLKEHPPSGAAAAAAATSRTSLKAAEDATQATSTTTSSKSHNDAPPPTKKQRVNTPSNSSVYSDLQGAVAELSNSFNGEDVNDIEKHIDKVYAMITRLKQNGAVISYKDQHHKDVSLIRVPVATSDKSYHTSNDWVLSALKINGKGDTENASRRVMQQLIKNNENSAHAALEKGGIKVVKQMNQTKMAAMFKDGNLNTTQQRNIMKHLRDHCGKKAFASLGKVAMFCEGATPVSTGKIEYNYEGDEDGVKETIEYYEKNIALEIAQQLGFVLTKSKKSPGSIKRIDIVLGGDHGCGAFVAGAKVIVTFSDNSAECFDVSVAEVLCRKDNAEILELTILKELTKGLKTMVDNELHIIRKANGSVECIFGIPKLEKGDYLVKKLRIKLYVTGDLAFYAMVIGKEGMSGHWCHLCKLTRKEFSDLAAEGEEWTTQAMIDTAEEVRVSEDKKPKLGVKTKLWWSFIDIQNYVVPLLHTLIGIGNDLLDNLKDIVNDKIETISTTEAKSRASLVTIEAAIESLVAERDSFDTSAVGKELKSLKRKIKVRETALKKLVVRNEQGDPEVDFQHLSNDDLINEVNALVAESDNGDIEDNGDSSESGEDNADDDDAAMEVDGGAEGDDNNNNDSTSSSNDNIDAAVREKIQKLEAELLQLTSDVKVRQEQRDTIAKRLKKARTLLARMKERITTMRSERRKKDGMEAKMEAVLKQVGVEIQRYHGGSLTGKDILKVVANATFIFDEFAKIFKEHRRDGCELTDKAIEDLCEDHKRVFLLWDGAFSHARTINPVDHDFNMYERYIKAAVFYHVKIGCSITPKVHLMLKHVLKQMRSFPGGLGDKMEDWVELMHQSGQRLRVRFRTVKSFEVRAKAMARTIQMNSNPAIQEQIDRVKENASTKRKSNNVDSKRKDRVESRLAALIAHEVGNAVVTNE